MNTISRKPTHPGEILQAMYLEPLGIGIFDFAEAIGVSRKTISAIINCRARVTPEMALRFAMALPSTNADFWLNLQKACDLFSARRRLELVNIAPMRVISQ